VSLPECPYLGWRADGNRAWRQILGDGRTGADDAAVANDFATENGNTRTQPYVPSDACREKNIGLRLYVCAIRGNPVI